MPIKAASAEGTVMCREAACDDTMISGAAHEPTGYLEAEQDKLGAGLEFPGTPVPPAWEIAEPSNHASRHNLHNPLHTIFMMCGSSHTQSLHRYQERVKECCHIKRN